MLALADLQVVNQWKASPANAEALYTDVLAHA